MVVKIRLARWGASHNPFYGVVVANHRAARDGKHLERVGTYDPIPDKEGIKRIELNVERIKYWLGVGAQPSDRVAWLLAKADLMPPLPTQLHRQGLLSLNDAKTWKVDIQSSTGTTLARLSGDEARQALEGSNLIDHLPKDEAEMVDRPRIAYEKLDLSQGRPPAQPLTDDERLRVLQAITGIY